MNKTELSLQLGLKIKAYRTKMGLSQEELAEKIERNQRQISLIELGRNFPKPETLIALSEIFNCKIRDLFDFEPLQYSENMRKELLQKIQTMPEEKIVSLFAVSKLL